MYTSLINNGQLFYEPCADSNGGVCGNIPDEAVHPQLDWQLVLYNVNSVDISQQWL